MKIRSRGVFLEKNRRNVSKGEVGRGEETKKEMVER